jgi:xylan 1,4-beta-xylosidase
VLFWDFTITNPTSENDQVFYKRDLPAAPKGKAVVRLTHVPPGRYIEAVYQMGYRTNDAYAAYRALGSPAQLTRAQVVQINAASDGKPVERAAVTVGPDGVFHRELPLRENDVFLILLEKQDSLTK